MRIGAGVSLAPSITGTIVVIIPLVLKTSLVIDAVYYSYFDKSVSC